VHVETNYAGIKGHIVDESALDPALHVNETLLQVADQDTAAVKRVIRKVDWRLVPMLGLLYSWAPIDRVNLPAVSTILLCYSKLISRS
jgi:hypothetical protein